MKTKLLIGFVLAAMGITSCKKDSNPTNDNTQVLIGDKLYRTVKIGNQLWTTSNYEGEGGVYYTENNAPKIEYGKFYTLAEAKAITLPQGWRLPAKEDFKTLVVAQGANWEQVEPNYGYSEDMDDLKKLLSNTGWPSNLGTNASGFNAQPAGMFDEGHFTLQGRMAYFWTNSATNGDNYPIYFHLVQTDGAGYAEYKEDGWSLEGVKMSTRFVKDL